MTKPFDLTNATITSTQKKLRDGSLSVSELVSAAVERAHETESELHAFTYLNEQAVMCAARLADQRLSSREPCGPLHGVPLVVKDQFATKDAPTEAGSAVFRGYRPQSDAFAVRRLRDAGAIVIGKQQMHEFGFGLDEPPTRNAWDATRYPGGSTAGGAVSVAVGSSLAALGTDGGGSIRKPASINGVVGFKPSISKISTLGIIPGVISVDHVGWITRSVADSVLLWSVLSGLPHGALAEGISGMRLGCPSFFFQDIEADIDREVRACLDALSEAGAILVNLEIPELELASEAHSVLVWSESYALHKRWITDKPTSYHSANLRHLLAAGKIGEQAVDRATHSRTALNVAMNKAFTDYTLDALCTPTVALAPVVMSEMDPERLLPQYTRLTIPFNLTGQPAISVPCGVDSDGLPVGFQIAARVGDEETVFRVADAVEASGIWTQPRSLGAVARQTSPRHATLTRRDPASQ